jgi:hypothetical protein
VRLSEWLSHAPVEGDTHAAPTPVVLPLTPETNDLGERFALPFPHVRDAQWLAAKDDEALARLERLIAPALAEGGPARAPLRASGLSGASRRRQRPARRGTRRARHRVAVARPIPVVRGRHRADRCARATMSFVLPPRGSL